MTGSFNVVLPITTLIAGAFGTYLIIRLFRLNNRINALITVVVLAVSLTQLILLIQKPDVNPPFFGVTGSGGIIYQPDVVGSFIVSVSLVIGILITIYSGESLSKDPRHSLYYPLILLSISGLMGMFFTNDLFNLFLLSELSNITASALIAFQLNQKRSVKAGFKYLVMSSLGTMIMLLGIYFVYQGTGTTEFTEITNSLNNFTRIGGGCFLVGFSLKAGVVPLHTWVPEVYTGAPSAISALLAGVLSKSMLFIMSMISLKLGLQATELGLYLMVFGWINMLLGSIRTLNKKHIKHFLSYSSIAQTGYLMFALGVGYYYQEENAFATSLFLFLVIALAKSLAFLASGTYEHFLEPADGYASRGVKNVIRETPYLLSLSLAGLAGIPPLAGFIGKWLVFSSAIDAGDVLSILGLAIFLLSTIIGLGGYLPMIVRLFQAQESNEKPANKNTHPTASLWMAIPMWVLSVLFIIIGFSPSPWLSMIHWILERIGLA